MNRPPRPSLLVLGATSGIAQGVIRNCAARGWRLHLVARSVARLEAVRADATVRGAVVSVDAVDLARLDGHAALLDRAWRELDGPPTHTLIAVGSMPPETGLATDPTSLAEIVATNFTLPAALVEALVARLETVQGSSLAVLASVAGDRPRGRMAVYGGAKAGVAAYLTGIRHRLEGRGPRIIIIKPGPVRTPMTADMESSGPMLEPDAAAQYIVRALLRADGVVYVPGWFRFAMLVVRGLPERLFWKLRV